MVRFQSGHKKRINIILVFALSLFLLSCGRGSYEAVSCPFPLKQLHMFDEKNGWGLSAENEILRTEDGIENLRAVNSSLEFSSTAFVDGQTAYGVSFSPGYDHLTVQYTMNGGASWQQTDINCEAYPQVCDAGNTYLSFADKQDGYLLRCSTPALGQMTKILFVTSDAGKTFTFAGDLTDTIAGYPQGITAVSKEQVNIAVTYHGDDRYLYQSSDDAMSWESAEIFPPTANIRYVDGFAPIFYGEGMQKGIILLKVMCEDAVYELFSTEDGGKSWTLAGKIPCDSPLSYSVSGDSQIYIIEQDGALYKWR